MRTNKSRAALSVTLIGLAASVALSACSSGSPTATTSTSSGSATTGSVSTTTSAASSSTTVALSDTCEASNLRIALYGSEGAAGTQELTFSLTDISTTPCTMHGYPGVLLLDASGTQMPTTEMQGGGLSFESLAVTDVSMTSGQAAYFNLGYSDVPVGSETSCPSASQIEVTPPGSTSHAVVSVSGVDACGGGAVNVSPVFSSTDTTATQTTTPHQN